MAVLTMNLRGKRARLLNHCHQSLPLWTWITALQGGRKKKEGEEGGGGEGGGGGGGKGREEKREKRTQNDTIVYICTLYINVCNRTYTIRTCVPPEAAHFF